MTRVRHFLNLQIIRFLMVGIVNTGFSYSIYAGLIYLGLSYIPANFGSLLLGILFSFHTQGSFVFRNRDQRLIFRFAACWLLIFLINIGLISVLMRAGLNAYIAGAAALPLVTVISYFVQKILVFGAVLKVARRNSSE